VKDTGPDCASLWVTRFLEHLKHHASLNAFKFLISDSVMGAGFSKTAPDLPAWTNTLTGCAISVTNRHKTIPQSHVVVYGPLCPFLRLEKPSKCRNVCCSGETMFGLRVEMSKPSLARKNAAAAGPTGGELMHLADVRPNQQPSTAGMPIALIARPTFDAGQRSAQFGLPAQTAGQRRDLPAQGEDSIAATRLHLLSRENHGRAQIPMDFCI
jgi:hypothetical protein